MKVLCLFRPFYSLPLLANAQPLPPILTRDASHSAETELLSSRVCTATTSDLPTCGHCHCKVREKPATPCKCHQLSGSIQV